MPHYYLIYLILLTGAALSIISRKLTVPAAITGFIVGLLIYKGAGYTGLAMLAVFFIAGSFATGWQLKRKKQLGAAEENNGRRTTGQVIANGGAAAILGFIAWLQPQFTAIIQLMIAGSLASATADTLSSELGTLYGRNFYDVISFKKVQPGPDGVISLEGTLIGMAGATLIAIVYSIGFGFTYSEIIIIIAAGFIGNLFDSILGATLERNHHIGNNTVNFLNTAIGAGVCLLLNMLIRLVH